eukprot:3488255-Pleurochrysis_carterae.AAC.1
MGVELGSERRERAAKRMMRWWESGQNAKKSKGESGESRHERMTVRLQLLQRDHLTKTRLTNQKCSTQRKRSPAK